MHEGCDYMDSWWFAVPDAPGWACGIHCRVAYSPTDNPDRVTEVHTEGLDRRVRIFRCGITVDSFAVVTERYLLVVDTMVNLESMGTVMGALEGEITQRPLLVINTHGDWDHVWGNGLFVGPAARYPAPIVGNRLTGEVMTAARSHDLLATFKAEHLGRYDSAEIWPPTVLVDGELGIDGGDLTLHLIPTPGHTRDHISVWIPEIGVLLAGDAVELPFPLVSEPDSLPQLRLSLQCLSELSPSTVLSCHAPGFTDAALIRHNMAYFDELERRCASIRASGEVPANLSAIEHPAELLGWPLEEALPPGVPLSDLTSVDFYRREHDVAIRAMLGWLRDRDS